MKLWIPFVIMVMIGSELYGQATRKMSRSLNFRSMDQLIPTLSGDGREIIYLSNMKGEGELNMWYSRKLASGGWVQPEPLPITLDNPGTNLLGGYNLSFDGTVLVFTSKRRGSMGGYDIWITEKEGDNWGTPRNAGKPVNSDLHEGDPFLSRDGRFLYFMRCKTLTNDLANDCEILVAEIKSNGYFQEPKRLPAPINTGNEITPRILADNCTLLFGSSRPGGKGGFDLYISSLEGESWSEPIPLDFINTEGDDRYLNIPIQGDVGYFSRESDGHHALFMVKIPEELQAKKVLWINGRVREINTDRAIESVVRIYDAESGEFIESMPTSEEGDFSAFLSQGTMYDLSVMPKEENSMFYSELLDLDSLSSSKKQNLLIELEPVAPEKSLVLDALKFKPFTSEVDLVSKYELQRVIALLKKNPDLKIEIGVHIKKVLSDSVFSNPDLTELVTDTLIDYRVIDIIDSVLSEVNNELVDSLSNDSDSLDSLRNIVLTYEPVVKKDTLTIQKILRTYHNDRTQKQADSIVEYLIEKGVPSGRLIGVGYGDSKGPMLFTDEFTGSTKVQIKFFQ